MRKDMDDLFYDASVVFCSAKHRVALICHIARLYRRRASEKVKRTHDKSR
jgi:hypothetical protein